MEREHEESSIEQVGKPYMTATEMLEIEQRWKERWNKAAELIVTPRWLWKMLTEAVNFPPEFEYVGARYDWDSDSIRIRIRCDSFPKIEDGTVPPVIELELHEDNDGAKRVTWSIPIHSHDPRTAYLQGYEAGLEAAKSASNR